MPFEVYRLNPEGVFDHVVAGLNAILPVLSKSAPPITIESLAEIVANASRIYVGALGGGIVGSATLVVQLQLTKRRGWIEDVVVAREHQGQGYGYQLMVHALDDAPADLKIVDLTSTLDKDDAHVLYVGLGFEKRTTDVYRLDMAAWRASAQPGPEERLLQAIFGEDTVGPPRRRVRKPVALDPAEIERLLQPLDEREREILASRFGLDCGEPRTLAEVAEHLSLTSDRVRQIEAEAMSKLRRGQL